LWDLKKCFNFAENYFKMNREELLKNLEKVISVQLKWALLKIIN